MTDSITVDIPSEVLDNTPRTVRITSTDAREVEAGWPAARQLEYYRETHQDLGYEMTEKDEVVDGRHITTTKFKLPDLDTVTWHFRTEYFTHVPCARCPDRWAQVYVVIQQDEWRTDPEPLCGDHWTREEIRASRSQRGGSGIAFKLHRSEWLRLAQF